VLAEGFVTVCDSPRVDLFVAVAPGPADRTLLVVRDLLALLDHFAPTDAVDVLGFSYGGCVAQRLAIAAPQRLRCLILASTTVLPVPEDSYDSWPARQQLADVASAVWETSAATGADLTREAAYAAAPLSVWRPEASADWADRLAAIRFSAEWLRPLRAGTLRPALPEHAAPQLAELDMAILLLHGRQDMTFPAVLAEQAADQIPRARAVLVDDAGHMAHVDQPTRWLSAVHSFL
jgi:pimeloyl-ACP methyl ester carboxylesterase